MTCRWHIGCTGVCVCPDSDRRADITDDTDWCEEWEEGKDSDGEKMRDMLLGHQVR